MAGDRGVNGQAWTGCVGVRERESGKCWRISCGFKAVEMSKAIRGTCLCSDKTTSESFLTPE